MGNGIRKSVFPLGFALLVLAFSSQSILGAVAEENFEGTYVSTENQSITMSFDAENRITTNLGFLYNGNQSIAPLAFPHRLKYSTAHHDWRSVGHVSFQYLSTFGVAQCVYPVTLVADFSSDKVALDVTLYHAAQYAVDSFGQCVAFGSTQEQLGFELQDRK